MLRVKVREGTSIGCGCIIMVLLFNLLVGGWACDYCLWFFFMKNVPWYVDVIIGAILAEFLFPLAICSFLLYHLGGIVPPLF